MNRTQLRSALLHVAVAFGAQGCMLIVGTTDYTTDGGGAGTETPGSDAGSTVDAPGAEAASGNDAATPPGTDAAGPTISAMEACTDLDTADCTRLNDCAPFLVTKTYGSLANCIQRNVLACLTNSAAPASIEACAQAVPSESCDQFFNNEPPAACNYVGPVARGGVCSQNAQCDERTQFCNQETAHACGVCTTRISTGGTCSDDAVCQLGLTCWIPSGDTLGTCVAPAALGASCNASQPCEGMLICNPSGVCGPALQVAAICTSQICDEYHGVFCNTSLDTCVQFQAQTANATCGVCGESGFCRSAPGATSGTCIAAAADGASCDPTNGPICVPPATCTGGTCQLPVNPICN